MRIVQVNLAYDASLADPAALLDRYSTLTEFSDALVAAGASVRVIQRFGNAATTTRNQVSYVFVCDGGPPMPSPAWISSSVIAAALTEAPDVFHVNGLMFPATVAALKSAAPRVPILVQDHGGYSVPSRLDRLRDSSWKRLRKADAWSFTSAAHAEPWRAARLLEARPIFEILEASTRIRPVPREEARRTTQIAATPAILWVGRLNENKDPLTVLAGLERAFERLPHAQCWMIYGEAAIEGEVRERVQQSAVLGNRVHLVGQVAHEHIANYYSAADVYISGSHREGSGYALIEAMACGLVPVVTDIPSFRAIASDSGARWQPGNAAACADALVRVASGDLSAARALVRARFERDLTWERIAARTLASYETLLGQTARGARRA